jgi:hypothetical protein
MFQFDGTKFRNPEIEEAARVAAELQATMMANASQVAEQAALTAITNGSQNGVSSSGFASFLSIHTATPGTTGTSEETPTGTTASVFTGASVSSGTVTLTGLPAHTLLVGMSTYLNPAAFTNGTGTGWGALNGTQQVVTAVTGTSISFIPITAPTGSATLGATPQCTLSTTAANVYNRMPILWGAASAAQPSVVANITTAIVINMDAATVTNFGTFANQNGTGGNGFVIGGALSPASIVFSAVGTLTVAIGGLTLQAS